MDMILIVALMLAMIYFFMIRPESKRKKEAQTLRDSLTVGDNITTIGGMTGTICKVDENTVVFETGADRVRIEVTKWAISTRNAAPGVLEETTEESIRETERWLRECGRFSHVRPMLTPRFTPSCTDELMAWLGKTARERHLPIQSHLSENDREIEWVRQLHPDCTQYWETYAKYGLWNDRTLMAHCVCSDQRERAAMKEAGVTVVHCPDSNVNVCSGTAPVRTMLQEGLKVALGSDIAGGDHLNMFDVTASAIRASKVRQMTDSARPAFLTVPEAWYLATSAGAAFFGEAPGFAPGNPLHAMVLSDDTLPQSHALTGRERFERCVYRRQPGALRAVWSAGRKVYEVE